MAKFLILLVASLMVVSSVQGGFHDLKNKLIHRYGGSHPHYTNQLGGGSYASASAAASTSAGGYGNSQAAAAASAATGGYAGRRYGGNVGGAASASSSAAVSGGSQYGGYGGAAASAAASTQNNVYAAPQQPAPRPVVVPPQPSVMAPPAEPQRPNFNIDSFKQQNGLGGGFRPFYGPGGVAASVSAASASAASGVSAGTGGNSALAAAAASGSYERGGYTAPGTFQAASGTFAHSNDNGIEQRHFSNEVDNMENHEMGRADDDHYYNAQSYGKAADDNDHINYNKNFEDVMSSPTVYHSVKSNESLLRDHNKSSRESGSAVMAKDHHSAGYQKHQKHFHQNTDSGRVQSGAGGAAYSTENDASNHNINSDDEMYFDSDGLNGGAATSAVGMATGYGAAAGASSAVRSAMGGSAASSASLGYGQNGFGQYGRFGGAAAASAAVN